jgi:hypothetical protein
VTNAFLERLFARYLLPEAVYDMALATYGQRYGHFFNVDSRLGARIATLLGSNDDDGLIEEALHVVNDGALDVALRGPKISTRLVQEILNTYRLSKTDKARLRSLKMPPDARQLLRTNSQMTSDMAPHESYFQSKFNYGLSHQRYEDKRGQEFAQDVTFDNLNPHWTPDSNKTAQLSQVLANEMGDGTSVESLESWRYFLALMDQGCKQSVIDIVAVAKILSSDVLQTA